MAKDQESIRQTSLVSTLDGKENRQKKGKKTYLLFLFYYTSFIFQPTVGHRKLRRRFVFCGLTVGKENRSVIKGRKNRKAVFPLAGSATGCIMFPLRWAVCPGKKWSETVCGQIFSSRSWRAYF